MKQKFWRAPKFKELEKVWEKKLADSGFIDAEKLINATRVFRQRASNSYRGEFSVICENKQRYYELLGHYYHDEKFQDPVNALVMERRSNGIKIKHICIELKKLGERNHRDTIRKIIRFYEFKWGIKKNN